MGFLLMEFLIMEFLRTLSFSFYIKQSHRNPIQLGVYEKGGMPSLKLTQSFKIIIIIMSKRHTTANDIGIVSILWCFWIAMFVGEINCKNVSM